VDDLAAFEPLFGRLEEATLVEDRDRVASAGTRHAAGPQSCADDSSKRTRVVRCSKTAGVAKSAAAI